MPTPPLPDEVLQETVDAYIRCGFNKTATGDELGIHNVTVGHRLKLARLRGINIPSGPVINAPPSGFGVKKVSSYTNKDGEVTGQWVQAIPDAEEKEQAFRLLADEIIKPITGKAKPIKAPKTESPDLMSLYPMGDPHIGMYAWAEEAGEDFDLEIAERDLVAAMRRLVQSAPKSETALILNLGDFFHSDNQDNRTARSGHALDVDTRWQKVLQVGARAFYALIDAALRKHKKVIVRNVIGNHDDHSAVFLSLLLDAYYRNEPRVDVALSPSAHWYHRFGKVLIGATHGDKSKWRDLAKIMAADCPEDWGRTQYRYWHTGHVHHDRTQEDMGVLMECHRTLAAKDAWHASMGYRSGRTMKCIVYDKDYGEVERHTADIRKVRDGR